MSSSEGKMCYVKKQDLMMNCEIFGQNMEEWLNWGSAPNGLRRQDMVSEHGENEMKRLADIVISGFVREFIRDFGGRVFIPLVLESIMAQYWKPPVSSFTIVWRYSVYDNEDEYYPGTPATTDSDAPEWPQGDKELKDE